MSFNNYPYTNLNSLNLDYIMQRISESPGEYAAQAAESAAQAAESARIAQAAANQTFVVFGDSWSDPDISVNNWIEVFTNITGWTCVHNYAQSGAGFVYPSSMTIRQQVTAFLASDLVSSTDFVFLVGGVNDYRHGVVRTDLRDEIKGIIADLRTGEYTGRIVFINNWEYPYTYAATTYWGILCTQLGAQVGAQIATINTYGLLDVSWINTDNYFHLTGDGSRTFGEIIAGNLGFGNYSPAKPSASIPDKLEMNYQYDNRSVMVHCMAIMPQGETSMSWTASDAALIPWLAGKPILIGTVGRSYNRFIMQINNDGSGSMVTEAAPNANTQVRFTWVFSV